MTQESWKEEGEELVPRFPLSLASRGGLGPSKLC